MDQCLYSTLHSAWLTLSAQKMVVTNANAIVIIIITVAHHTHTHTNEDSFLLYMKPTRIEGTQDEVVTLLEEMCHLPL